MPKMNGRRRKINKILNKLRLTQWKPTESNALKIFGSQQRSQANFASKKVENAMVRSHTTQTMLDFN